MIRIQKPSLFTAVSPYWPHQGLTRFHHPNWKMLECRVSRAWLWVYRQPLRYPWICNKVSGTRDWLQYHSVVDWTQKQSASQQSQSSFRSQYTNKNIRILVVHKNWQKSYRNFLDREYISRDMSGAQRLFNRRLDSFSEIRTKVASGPHLQEQQHTFVLVLGSSLTDTKAIVYIAGELLHDRINLSRSETDAAGVQNTITAVREVDRTIVNKGGQNMAWCGKAPQQFMAQSAHMDDRIGT